MNEFDLIAKYFDWDADIGDDCAIINPTPDTQLVTSVDTLIQGVHFPHNTTAGDIAYKALAVNLSDLAAMGATPKYFTLALTLPELDEAWLREFSTSLKALARTHNIDLIGGDTTKGALSITINVMGEVPAGKALLRSSAQTGDLIFVSGTLGAAALAWQQIEQGDTPSDFCLGRFNRPTARIALGQQLIGIANACIDISDGLEQDLSHILKCSNVGASINLADIPVSDEVRTYAVQTQDWCLALAGGDDYELCFSVPKTHIDGVKSIAESLSVTLTQIGVISSKQGLDIKGLKRDCQSYQHF